jgi:hypothetical protein
MLFSPVRIACSPAQRPPSGEFSPEVYMSWSELEKHRDPALNPNWAEFDSRSKHTHDWRTYVTDEVRAIWDTIPVEGRMALIDCCESAANLEEWN